jgi:predicted DsbA family dithiol-disulfide isomerase
MRIDIVTEITCPWCLIALHRLDTVLARAFPDLHVDIVHHPLVLSADFPEQGHDPAGILRVRYGIADPATAWARPEAEARASGLALDLSKQPRLYSTQRAHALIRRARASTGDQHRLAVAITKAFFLEHRDIHDPAVLAQIAVHHGFTIDEALSVVSDPAELDAVNTDAARTRRSGVQSVPLFRFPNGAVLQTASEEAYADAIRQSLRTRS